MGRSALIVSVAFLFVATFSAFNNAGQGEGIESKFDVPIKGRNYRSHTGVVATKLNVRKATPHDDAAIRRLAIEFVRDNDTGTLIAASENGDIAVVDRPRFALANIALHDSALVIRYHVYSGAASFTSNNTTSWTKIEDETPPPPGLYEIRITGPYAQGDSDKKDYFMVTRIERNTGMCWYRSGTKWLPLQEPENEQPAE